MRVHALQTGTVAVRPRQLSARGPAPARLAATLSDRRWTEPLPIHAWLIEHPEGLILVDTGETAQVAEPGYLPAWQVYFELAVRARVAPEDEIGPRLRALGFDPDDVRWVVLTHLHSDHAGGVGHFPRSEILVTRREHANAQGLLGKLRGFLPHRWPAWFDPRLVELDESPYGPFPASHRLTAAGDVVLVPTPGHTPGHVSVVVETGSESLFLAGDASYTEELMLAGAVDGVSPDGRASRRSTARIRDFCAGRPTVYLPSHDPGSAQRLRELRPVGVWQESPA